MARFLRASPCRTLVYDLRDDSAPLSSDLDALATMTPARPVAGIQSGVILTPAPGETASVELTGIFACLIDLVGAWPTRESKRQVRQSQ